MWGEAAAFDDVRTWWRPVAGNWPLSHLRERDCYFEVVAVTSQAVEVEILTVVAEVDPEAAEAFEVVPQLLRHPRSLDSNVSSASNTFPRPPI